MFNYDPKRDGPEAVDLFDKVYARIKFDKSLYKKLHKFRLAWTRKSGEYAEFLGGNTLGVQAVRFSTRDVNALLSDIYKVDAGELLNAIRKLPDIDESWAVSTNPVSQTMVYTMHRFMLDGKLGKDTEKGMRECYYIMAYNIIGSLMSNYFSHPANPAVAKATTERMSNRFLLKRLGSWNEVLKYRAGDVLPPDGLHVDRIRTYSTEDSVRVINDLQGRIRELFKSTWSVMADIMDSGSIVDTWSATKENTDGEQESKPVTNRPDRYVIAIKEVVGTPASFIDNDIVHMVTSLVGSSDDDIVRASLERISNTYDPKVAKHDYIATLIIKNIVYINSKGITGDYRSNALAIIKHMKGYWSSGSVKDSDVNAVKDTIRDIVIQASGRRTKWVISANTLAVIVYIFVRSIK